MISFPSLRNKIDAKLPEKFALIFDGWDSRGGNYVDMFASFAINNAAKYELGLLTFLDFKDEENADANEHNNFINYILELFGKSASNLGAIVWCNGALNKSIARILKVGFVGCRSQRFNLTVTDLLKISYDTISVVR